MSKMITQNQTLNFFSEIKKHIGACCFLVMLVMMSGTAWAQIPGEVCEGPITITGLPFSVTDNTSDYGDDYESGDRPALAANPVGTPSAFYLGGDDVVYAYTAAIDGFIDLTVSNHGDWAGVFVFTGCPFTSTVGGATNSSAAPDLIVNGLPVLSGETYYIVISTYPTPQSTSYTLNVSETIFDCPNLSADFGDACNDGNANTINDVVSENCDCAGVLPPAGSACSNAFPIECNADPVTFSSAASIATNTTACSMGSKGLWFSFMGTGGDITVNSVATFDHEMSVNTGFCDALTNLACKDLASPFVGGTETYLIESSIVDQMYYVYVAQYSATSTITGDITIDIECATPPLCTPPTLELTVQDADGTAIEGCLDSGSEYFVSATLSGGSGNDSYNVIANGDTLVAVADGSVVLGPFVAGNNINVTAVGVQDDACDVSASIDSPAICAPFNDNCADAISIACDESLEGTTIGATVSEGITQSCGSFGSKQDVFYSLDATEGFIYTVSVASGSDYDAVLSVFNGGCDNLIAIDCKDANGTSGVESITFTAPYSGTFLIRTYDYSSNKGSFTISLSCDDGSVDCEDLGLNIGDACDDGDATTVNDVVTADCECIGEPATVGSVCETAIPVVCNADPATYSSADSNGSNTTTCFMGNNGLWFSFTGTGEEIIINSSASFDHRLSVNSGSCDDLTSIACQDGSTGAENYTIASSVEGEMYYVYIARYNSGSTTTGDITISLVCASTFDCPQLEANIGDACDDGDDSTENDLVDANCGCAGTPIIVFDCPVLEANIGDDCDDQNADTENDVIDANCGCAGTPIIVFDCPQLEANIGDDCDDQNADTENDVIDANCGCAGTPIIVFDCPQLEANIGDACDDQNPDTENDVIDANCGCAGTPVQEFDCPQLEANFGEACNDGDPNTGNDVIISDCSCAGTPIVIPTCDDFVYYISDHSSADGISDIYAVTLSGGVATMEYIATSDIEIHIAYNSVDNLIYAVSKHTNSYRTLNPHVVAPSFGPTITLGADYGELTAAVFNADGKLLIGSQNNNAIYSVNVVSNLVSSYDTYAPVTGGDLAFASDGMLYLATRSGNGLYEVYPADVISDILIGSVTSKVTGLAITDSDQLLVSNQGNSSLEVRNLNGTNPGTTYLLTLDGEPYTLRDGDMASGCNSYDQPLEGECIDFKIYYIHDAAGSGPQPLLEVTLNGDGTASYTEVMPNLGGHIGLSPDGSIIYNVGDNDKLKIVDVASATVLATLDIKTAGGVSISNFPTAVVGSDGTFYAGSHSTNQVYTIDPSTAIATPYGPSRTVNGGDLIEVNDEIWLVTRNNSTVTNVLTGASFIVPVNEINGAVVLTNGNVLFADGDGGSLLKEVNLTSLEVVATHDIGLPLFNGDLAGGCILGGGLNTQCYGSEILDFVQGLQTNGSAVPANRSDATAALGQPDASNAAGGFVSLGVGGYITIGFGGVIYDAPGNDIRIWETSFSGDVCGSSDDEQADIALSQDGVNFISVGSICRDGEVDIAGTGLDYVSAIRITNSASTASLDGYDVDGVEAINGCSDEPVVEEGDCYATEVVEYIQGTSSNGGAIAANRTDASKALGAPERVDQLVFVSLGYGGSITLAFDGAIPNGPGDDIEVVETTYGNSSCATYPEFADVYVSVDGINFFFAKTVCRADGFVDISSAGSFAYVNFVKVVNNNTLSTTPDAFDVDGVVALYNCEEEPVTPGLRPVTESALSSFPNPTAGTSQVVFVTAETGRTLVEVYDMSGRNIATLFNAETQNGKEYTLNFDGAALPNGVYIYRMTTNNESIVEKFMIAR